MEIISETISLISTSFFETLWEQKHLGFNTISYIRYVWRYQRVNQTSQIIRSIYDKYVIIPPNIRSIHDKICRYSSRYTLYSWQMSLFL
jgi:hypothetical protein